MTTCDHEWKQVGRCAYCTHCNRRVQGKAPKDEEGRQALNAFLESLKGLAEPVPPRKRTIKRVTN